MLIPIGILVILVSIGIVKTAAAVEPPLRQEEARAVRKITSRVISAGVNE
jgi:hypothetical protein